MPAVESAVTSDQRRQQLADNLVSVRQRIAAACAAASRPAESVQLIAVTKFFPASDALALFQLGVDDFGESRDQEASVKVSAVAAQIAGLGSSTSSKRPRWHFVGRLQTNKARSVSRYADVVHSVDRPDLVRALADGVERAARDELTVLLQLSLDGDTARAGARADAVLALAAQVASTQRLRLGGVMAVAPLDADPDAAFQEVAQVSARLRVEYPSADIVSAGMSADLEAAVVHGATHVRIGTALLGRRVT
ncbi:MAG: alanine racemase domain protein [Frankiales bacterium]|nr:alanine racemase domain protein [Frankiales bacterium]